IGNRWTFIRIYLLTGFITTLATLAAWPVTRNSQLFYFLMLAMYSGQIGLFSFTRPFTFFYHVGVRINSCLLTFIHFILYTAGGSIFFLIGVLGMGLYERLINQSYPTTLKYYCIWASLLLMLTCMLLAGILLKMEHTDLIRVNMELIAYSSVSHMGFIIIGIGSITNIGLNGAILQILSHGFIELGGISIPMPKIFTMFSSFSMASLALPGMSGFVAELVVFFGLITSPKFMLMPKMLITFVMAIGMILTPIYLLSMLRQMFYGYKLFHVPNKNFVDSGPRELFLLICIFLPVIGIGIYPDLVLSLSVDRVESGKNKKFRKKVKNAEFVPFQFGFFLLCKYIANMKNQVLYEEYTEYELVYVLKSHYKIGNFELNPFSNLFNNSYFIFIINYNEMHFNESLYTLINMIPHIRGEIKRRISYKYRFSLEFNQSITKQESSFILTKRNTKMIRKKIHNSSIFYFSYFVFLIPLERDKNSFFNTSMLGLVTSSNLIQIYFFWELVGMCSYLLIGFCACQKAFEF
ncbi:hypothetical protein ACJX0J_003180, partial [Zea mays]